MGRLDTSRRRRISHGARRLPAEVTMDRPQYEPLAQIEVDAARPEPQGFTLTGQGPDHAEYQLDLRFEMPLDPRTRTVLGELLSHSDLTISRRAPGGSADRKSTRLNSSHTVTSYAVFCLK